MNRLAPRLTMPLAALALTFMLAIVGAAVAREPTVTTAVVGGSVVAVLLFAQGMQTLLVGTLFLFPLIPANLNVGGVYPQRSLLIILGITLLLEHDAVSARLWRIRALGPAPILFAAFLAVGCLSVITSPLPSAAGSGVGFYAINVGLALLVGILAADGSVVERYGVAVCGAALVVAGLAVLQYVAPSGPWAASYFNPATGHETLDAGSRALGSRASATLGHPVALGTYAAMTLPFVIRLVFVSSRRIAWLAQAALIALVVAIMLSQTRMAMLAVVPAVLPWLVIASRRRVIVWSAVAAVIGLVAIVGVGGLARQKDVLAQTLSYRGERSSSDIAENNIAARSDIYVTGLKVLGEHPVLGVGFRLPTQHFDAPVFQNAGRVYAFESYMIVLLVEGGILGAALFAAFALSLVRAAHRRMPDRNDRATVYSAVLTGFTLSIASNGFDVVISYYWLLIGLTCGLAVTTGLRIGPRAVRS